MDRQYKRQNPLSNSLNTYNPYNPPPQNNNMVDINKLRAKEQENANLKKLLAEKDRIINEYKNKYQANLNNSQLILNNHLYEILKENKLLKDKLKNATGNPSNQEKWVTINFESADQQIKHAISCKPSTKLIDLLGELFDKYPGYVNNNFHDILFLCGGSQADLLKSVKDLGFTGYSVLIKKPNS